MKPMLWGFIEVQQQKITVEPVVDGDADRYDVELHVVAPPQGEQVVQLRPHDLRATADAIKDVLLDDGPEHRGLHGFSFGGTQSP